MKDLPGLQERSRKDSSTNDDSDDNQDDDKLGLRESRSEEEYHFEDRDNKQEDQYPYVNTSTNITPLAKCPDDDNDNDNDDDDGKEYDGDKDDEKDNMSRLATKYPTALLQLREGNGPPWVKTVTEENPEEVSDNDVKVIVKDVNEEEENEQLDNPYYNKQGIFGQYTNYGYSRHKTTIDESSIDTDDTVNKTKKWKPIFRLINQGTRDVPTKTNNDTEVKLLNGIKALSGWKFKGKKLTTYEDAFGPKEEGMLRISGFNTKSIKLNEIESTCQESIDLKVDIQCYQ